MHAVWFHVYEMSRMDTFKFKETEGRFIVAQDWGRGSKIDCNIGPTTVNGFKTTELYTLNGHLNKVVLKTIKPNLCSL